MTRIFVPTSSLGRDSEATKDFARRTTHYRTEGTKIDCFGIEPPMIDGQGM